MYNHTRTRRFWQCMISFADTVFNYLSPLPSLNEVVFQDVQAAHHLGEDEHLVPSGLHLRQQFVNKDQLPSRLHHSLQVKVDGSRAIHLSEVL